MLLFDWIGYVLVVVYLLCVVVVFYYGGMGLLLWVFVCGEGDVVEWIVWFVCDVLCLMFVNVGFV